MMLLVYGLDPGTEKSSLAVFNGLTVVDSGELANDEMLAHLDMERPDGTKPGDVDRVLVIEQIESFGMAVGREVFETVWWSGRFAQVWTPRRFVRLTRREVKQHLCHSARATDSNIRQALIDRFGPGSEKAIGKKKTPGPLYGVTGHRLAALAVAVTWFDQQGHLPPEIRPGIRPEF